MVVKPFPFISFTLVRVMKASGSISSTVLFTVPQYLVDDTHMRMCFSSCRYPLTIGMMEVPNPWCSSSSLISRYLSDTTRSWTPPWPMTAIWFIIME